MFRLNPDIAFCNFKKMILKGKDIKYISQSNINDNQDFAHSLLPKVFYLLGMDKSSRPILAVDLSHKFSVEILTKNLVKMICYIKDIINNHGKSKNLIIFMNMKALTENLLCEYYESIITIFQLLFPSRLHCLYLKFHDEATFAHIEKAFLSYNLERIRIVDMKMIDSMKKEIDEKFIEMFFLSPSPQKRRKSLADIKEELGFSKKVETVLHNFNSGNPRTGDSVKRKTSAMNFFSYRSVQYPDIDKRNNESKITFALPVCSWHCQLDIEKIISFSLLKKMSSSVVSHVNHIEIGGRFMRSSGYDIVQNSRICYIHTDNSNSNSNYNIMCTTNEDAIEKKKCVNKNKNKTIIIESTIANDQCEFNCRIF